MDRKCRPVAYLVYRVKPVVLTRQKDELEGGKLDTSCYAHVTMTTPSCLNVDASPTRLPAVRTGPYHAQPPA